MLAGVCDERIFTHLSVQTDTCKRVFICREISATNATVF